MSGSVLFDVPGPVSARRHRIAGIVSSIVLLGLLALVLWRFADQGQLDGDKWEPVFDPDTIRGLAEGLRRTLEAALAAVALSLLFGAVFAAGRLSDRAWLRWPAGVVVEFFRAVPLVLLILGIFLGYADRIGAFWSLVIALVLYNGSVLAEIFRAGIAAVPRGQSEAAYAVGMRKGQVMRLVLVPQALRSMLPAIISQSVVALKDTSLGFIIAYQEFVRVGQQTYSFYNNPLQVGLALAVVYVVMNYSLSRVAVALEGRQRRLRPTAAAEGTTETPLADIDTFGAGGPHIRP